MIPPYCPESSPKFKLSIKRILASASVVPLALLVKDIPGARDNLPEPIDVIDHLSNAAYGVFPGYIIGNIVGKISLHRSAKERKNSHDIDRVRNSMLIGGLAMGGIINLAVETRYGLQLFGDFKVSQSTPDITDLVYGTLATGIAAYTLPEIQSIQPSE
ncbi:MAG TPA: hypothetical protein PKD20_05085 [Candidatus Saccharibacteria bacterium]|jgi:hypothetical protein|nr:hypothetical protein [Candidatus Saccharibacteria bacterium]HMT56217.1 hypothetical protein [Candidatus Saccharibacteria bacterium]